MGKLKELFEKLKKEIWWGGVLVSVVVIGVIIFYYKTQNIPWGVEWVDDPMGTIGAVSGGVILAAALLDQLIELFVMDKEPKFEREKKMARVRMLEKKVNSFKTVYETRGVDKDKDILVQSLKDLSEKKVEIASNDEERRRKIRQYAFAGGFILAAAGVRVLTPLIEFPETDGVPDPCKYSWGLWVLIGADILMTASLLSGGSAGVSKFFTFLSDRIK